MGVLGGDAESWLACRGTLGEERHGLVPEQGVHVQTLAGIRTRAELVAHLSGERIAAELDKLLAAPAPSVGLRLLSETGLLVPIRARDALVDAMSRLIGDRSLRTRLGGEARSTALQRYTWDRAAEPVLHAYEALA